MKDSLDLIFEVSKLVKFSPERDVHFEELKNKLAPDITEVKPGSHRHRKG